jgi:hypothetical protein
VPTPAQDPINPLSCRSITAARAAPALTRFDARLHPAFALYPRCYPKNPPKSQIGKNLPTAYRWADGPFDGWMHCYLLSMHCSRGTSAYPHPTPTLSTGTPAPAPMCSVLEIWPSANGKSASTSGKPMRHARRKARNKSGTRPQRLRCLSHRCAATGGGMRWSD